MSKFKLVILKSKLDDTDQVVKDSLAKFNELPGIRAIHLHENVNYDIMDVDVPVSTKIFYIDTFDADPDRAEAIVAKFKKEYNEKRVVDTSKYNPLIQMEDCFIPLSNGASRSRVEIMKE